MLVLHTDKGITPLYYWQFYTTKCFNYWIWWCTAPRTGECLFTHAVLVYVITLNACDLYTITKEYLRRSGNSFTLLTIRVIPAHPITGRSIGYYPINCTHDAGLTRVIVSQQYVRSVNKVERSVLVYLEVL